jgi:ABC-type transport system substrate-binding protein
MAQAQGSLVSAVVDAILTFLDDDFDVAHARSTSPCPTTARSPEMVGRRQGGAIMARSKSVKARGALTLLLLMIGVLAGSSAAQTPSPEGHTFTSPGRRTGSPAGSTRRNGLVYHDPVNPDRIVCDLCESWTVSRDGKTYTFRLRQAQWHDGQPVTAEDIKFSLDRIVEPGPIRVRTGVLRAFYEHGSARVIDDPTVRVPITFASPLFLENLALEYMKMYPKHVAKGVRLESLSTSAGSPRLDGA